MQLAARCGTVKEIYETELNKIASAAKYLPYSAVNIKKEILDKAHAKAYNMPENTSISIFNLKNGIIAIIIMFAALFSYAKIKRHIDFHTMSPEEKQRMEETANAVYSNRDIDGTFKSHSELQKKTGKKRTGF